jgi:hypothetical protein
VSKKARPPCAKYNWFRLPEIESVTVSVHEGAGTNRLVIAPRLKPAITEETDRVVVVAVVAADIGDSSS